MMMNFLSIKKLVKNEMDPTLEYLNTAAQNLVLTFFIGLPGYGQIKQTLMNREIVQRPGVVAGIWCGVVAGVLYIAGFPITTLVPR